MNGGMGSQESYQTLVVLLHHSRGGGGGGKISLASQTHACFLFSGTHFPGDVSPRKRKASMHGSG